MSEEQLNAFLEVVKADTALQDKIKAAEDADAVVAIAKAAGFTISSEQLNRARVEVSEEEELEHVAGGRKAPPDSVTTRGCCLISAGYAGCIL